MPSKRDSGLRSLVSVREHLENLAKQGQIVKGRVLEEVKGGFAVNVLGMRGFLPRSQTGAPQTADLTGWVGKDMDFKIIKARRRASQINLVVSCKKVLLEEKQRRVLARLERLRVGDAVHGVAVGVKPFGVFLDIGGVVGLIHVSDMSWKRVERPEDIVREGQEFEVQVLAVDIAKSRVSLGLKQMTPDPWVSVESRHPKGSRVRGMVTKLAQFGAFVDVEEGVEGLVHVSEMSWKKRPRHPGDILKAGQEVEAMVLDIDMAHRRLNLGLRAN